MKPKLFLTEPQAHQGSKYSTIRKIPIPGKLQNFRVKGKAGLEQTKSKHRIAMHAQFGNVNINRGLLVEYPALPS